MSSEVPQRVPVVKSMMHPILQKVVFTPETLTEQDAIAASKEITEGRATEAQIGAYIAATGLRRDLLPIRVVLDDASQERLNDILDNKDSANEADKIKPILRRVYLKESFTMDDATAATKEIMEGRAASFQVGFFLIALKLNKFDVDPAIVAACAVEMRNHGRHISFEDHTALQEELVDIVGTGGDGHDTFNVSTTAAIVAAGAGCKVAKHGNKAASSACGSADILIKYGCQIENVEPENVAPLLNEHGFCFLFAQTYHPAMKNTSVPRREVGIPSIFNLMGPLSNPAKPKRIVVGVHSRYLGDLMIRSLQRMGLDSGMVVCGADGLDEISPEKETHVWKLVDGEIIEEDISPDQFGLPSHPLTSVKGGGPEENTAILRDLLGNKFESPGHPILDFVLINAAALLVVAGKARDFKEGVTLARLSVTSGEALRVLEGFRLGIERDSKAT